MTPFPGILVPERFRDATSDRAWLQAMLDAEQALARAEARVGVIPAAAAEAIANCCRADLYDPAVIAEQGRAVGNPAEPLVRALRGEVGGEAASFAHWGATSQDIVDTAAMLVAARSLDLLLAEIDGVSSACAELAREHRSTPMAARTLLQQAVPTTFGAKAAGWLAASLEARVRIREVRAGLAAQLGGAAGTLAPLGEHGLGVLAAFAEELGLVEPVVPWHTNRTRIAEIGAALALAAGVAAKIGLDVTLLAQNEVAEAAEAWGGASSTMPHKRNPVGSTLAQACARIARGHASVLAAALEQEHERATGGWQAEWEALSGALCAAGGAVASIGAVLRTLEVDAGRMRANLDASGGLVCAERVSFALAAHVGTEEAHHLVAAAARSASASGTPFRDALLGVSETLTAGELDLLLDPAGYLGSAEAFVDRALALYETGR